MNTHSVVPHEVSLLLQEFHAIMKYQNAEETRSQFARQSFGINPQVANVSQPNENDPQLVDQNQGFAIGGGAIASVVSTVGIDTFKEIGKALVDHYRHVHEKGHRPLSNCFKIENVGAFISKILCYGSIIALGGVAVWAKTNPEDPQSLFIVQICLLALAAIGKYGHSTFAKWISTELTDQVSMQTMAQTMAAAMPGLSEAAMAADRSEEPITLAPKRFYAQVEENDSWYQRILNCCNVRHVFGRTDDKSQEIVEIPPQNVGNDIEVV